MTQPEEVGAGVDGGGGETGGAGEGESDGGAEEGVGGGDEEGIGGRVGGVMEPSKKPLISRRTLAPAVAVSKSVPVSSKKKKKKN